MEVTPSRGAVKNAAGGLADAGISTGNVGKKSNTALSKSKIKSASAKKSSPSLSKNQQKMQSQTAGSVLSESTIQNNIQKVNNLKGQLYTGLRNPDVDFMNAKGKSTLDRHWDKYGYTSSEEYLKDARNFLEKKPTLSTQSFVSNEGTYFRYDTATNEFGIINKYGGISTYFKPDTTMAYWLEQIEKFAPK